MSDTAQAVGGRIRVFRKKRGISCHELGRRVGINASMLSKVERGLTATSLDRYAAIAKELGVSMAALFSRRVA